jgi:hypothetical protein
MGEPNISINRLKNTNKMSRLLIFFGSCFNQEKNKNGSFGSPAGGKGKFQLCTE